MRRRTLLALVCAAMAATGAVSLSTAYFSAAREDTVAIATDTSTRWLTVAPAPAVVSPPAARSAPVDAEEPRTSEPLTLTTAAPLPEEAASIKVAPVAVLSGAQVQGDEPAVDAVLVADGTELDPATALSAGQTFVVRLREREAGALDRVVAVRFTLTLPDGSVLVVQHAVPAETPEAEPLPEQRTSAKGEPAEEKSADAPSEDAPPSQDPPPAASGADPLAQEAGPSGDPAPAQTPPSDAQPADEAGEQPATDGDPPKAPDASASSSTTPSAAPAEDDADADVAEPAAEGAGS